MNLRRRMESANSLAFINSIASLIGQFVIWQQQSSPTILIMNLAGGSKKHTDANRWNPRAWSTGSRPRAGLALAKRQSPSGPVLNCGLCSRRQGFHMNNPITLIIVSVSWPIGRVVRLTPLLETVGIDRLSIVDRSGSNSVADHAGIVGVNGIAAAHRAVGRHRRRSARIQRRCGTRARRGCRGIAWLDVRWRVARCGCRGNGGDMRLHGSGVSSEQTVFAETTSSPAAKKEVFEGRTPGGGRHQHTRHHHQHNAFVHRSFHDLHRERIRWSRIENHLKLGRSQ